MSDSITRFITQMKLRELSRQRIRLRKSYQSLLEEVALATSDTEAISHLYLMSSPQ